MEYVRNNDWYEIHLASIITGYDRKILDQLYMPLIGYASLALYHYFWTEAEKSVREEVSSHEHLFTFMQMSPSEFQKAREKLEAIGLLRTYFKEEGGVRFFTYLLYAPKSPDAFFQDPLFSGLYEKYVGKKEAEKMARSFSISFDNLKGMEEVSASFSMVFHPNLDEIYHIEGSPLAKEKKRSRVSGDIKTEFDFGTFFEVMKNKYGILSDKVFTAKEKKEIERIAMLFGLDGEAIADATNRTLRYDEKGKPYFSLDELPRYVQDEMRFPSVQKRKGSKSQVSSQSRLAEKIRLLESCSPYEYLRIKQNMTKPVPSDVALLNRLSSNLGLPNSVINVLVDYVLDVKDNTLPAAFVEKIGASLVRAQIDNALDAMNFLNKKKYKKKASLTPLPYGEDAPVDEPKKETSTSAEDEELEALLKEMH